MRYLIVILMCLGFLAFNANVAPSTTKQIYPIKELTPGVVFDDVSKEDVCVPGYSEKARHVSAATKTRVRKIYREALNTPDYCSKGECEIDHFISLCLGGSNDIHNLWPQPYSPYPGAKEKDVVESNLCKRVCNNELTLEEAQKIMQTDWYAEYKRITSK